MILVVAATARELGGLDPGVRTLVCGVGPVEAAASTAAALARARPQALLNVGLAGCRRGCGLAPPALVLGQVAVYCDVAGTGERRFPVVDRVEPDAALLERGRVALPETELRPIGTSARVGGGTGCDVEAMEGFAVLRAASLAGVPALELRAIANEVEEDDRARWQLDRALGMLFEAMPRLLRALL
ncbi:MAG: phosphorylase family protein [Gaiellaceae bacterium]